ncbi:hypothetical protein, partial [Xanthobacter sp. NFM-97]|uniref:hypothetical protein n=1 Tax=Xanthobacter sp. NFM-97 TaxID=2744464 RepID=UPI001F36479F
VQHLRQTRGHARALTCSQHNHQQRPFPHHAYSLCAVRYRAFRRAETGRSRRALAPALSRGDVPASCPPLRLENRQSASLLPLDGGNATS